MIRPAAFATLIILAFCTYQFGARTSSRPLPEPRYVPISGEAGWRSYPMRIVPHIQRSLRQKVSFA